MKILIASPIYPPEIGGPATYTKELVERLSDAHSLTVIAYTNNTSPIEGSTLISIPKNLPLIKRLFRYSQALWKAAPDTDIIYVQNAMAAGLPAMLVGKIRRKPVVLKFVGDEAWERATQHGKTKMRLVEFLAAPDAGFRYTLMMKIQGFVLRNVSLVTTPSEYLGTLIQNTYGVSPEKIKTNYNAAEKPTEAPFEIQNKPHQIAASARLMSWKGVDGIIHATKLLLLHYPDVHLVINGDGPERENLEALTKELQLEEHVTFTGDVSRTETWHTRKESGVYVLNSTYEGLPHTALTSFAARIPLIATDIPGTNEAVYHEESGLLIPIEKPKALAEAITRIFDNADLRKQLIAGGEKILTEKFSWETHVATLLSFFESVSSKPRN